MAHSADTEHAIEALSVLVHATSGAIMALNGVSTVTAVAVNLGGSIVGTALSVTEPHAFGVATADQVVKRFASTLAITLAGYWFAHSILEGVKAPRGTGG